MRPIKIIYFIRFRCYFYITGKLHLKMFFCYRMSWLYTKMFPPYLVCHELLTAGPQNDITSSQVLNITQKVLKEVEIEINVKQVLWWFKRGVPYIFKPYFKYCAIITMLKYCHPSTPQDLLSQ